MDKESILKLIHIEKLKEIGQHNPGTLVEMKMRLRKFSISASSG